MIKHRFRIGGLTRLLNMKLYIFISCLGLFRRDQGEVRAFWVLLMKTTIHTFTPTQALPLPLSFSPSNSAYSSHILHYARLNDIGLILVLVHDDGLLFQLWPRYVLPAC